LKEHLEGDVGYCQQQHHTSGMYSRAFILLYFQIHDLVLWLACVFFTHLYELSWCSAMYLQ